MAMNSDVDKTAPKLLNPILARVGAVSWLVVAATSLTLSLLRSHSATSVLAAVVAGGVLVAFPIYLLKGRNWPHPIMMCLAGFWAVLNFAFLTWVFMKATGSISLPSGIAWWDVMEAGVLLAVELGVMAILWLAALPRTRLRYGSNAIVTGVVALALFVVVNLIAQGKGNYWRRDMQFMGQYGLSEWSKKVLRAVDEPVKITSLYSTSEANADQPERAARVWELLTEIRDLNPKIEIARATSDADRAEIVSHVAERMRKRAPAHAKLLQDFLSESTRLMETLRGHQNQWKQLAGRSYLDLWEEAANIAHIMKVLIQGQEEPRMTGLEQVTSDLMRDLGGLPDYAGLSEEVRSYCARSKEILARTDKSLKTLSDIPTAVAANRAAAAARMDELVAAVRESAKALSGGAATEPADPSALLRRFAAALQEDSNRAIAAAQQIDEIAGSRNAGVVRSSSAWLVGGDESPIIFEGMITRNNLTLALLRLSRSYQQQKTVVEGILQSGTKEYQASVLGHLRAAMAKSVEEVEALAGQANEAVARLAAVDPETAEVFKHVVEGNYLQGPISQLTRIEEAAAKLPSLPPSTLAGDLREERETTVLVETGDKIEAVRFDQMWPIRARPSGPGGDLSEQRTFNGDSAVSSKVLAMTQKPCATAILTYIASPPMGPYGGETGMTPRVLEILQDRLRQANFRVRTWDMGMYDSPAEAVDPNDPSMPKVLIVLPPPETRRFGRPDEPSAFGPQQIARLRRVIDSGEASGAIFLATFQFPPDPYSPSPPYGWNDYLKPEWGIEARTDCMALPTERDKTGTRFRLALRWRYLPLSTFSDHPIGKPLQGQRVYWNVPCPVTILKKRPPGVTAEPLLTVPPNWTNCWATSDVRRVQEQLDAPGSFITPDYERGDIKPPFDVAVAATRQAEPNEGAGAARIVVLGMAASFVDGYLESPVVKIEENVISTEDPPRGDLDVVVNSAYWLCGHADYIASGPIQVQPIRRIDDTVYVVLRTACVFGLPILLLGVGGVVLLLRRR